MSPALTKFAYLCYTAFCKGDSGATVYRHATRKGVRLLSVFEALVLMLAFATLVLTLKSDIDKKK